MFVCLCDCVYVCMCVCVYVCLYICMSVCMYAGHIDSQWCKRSHEMRSGSVSQCSFFFLSIIYFFDAKNR